MQWKGPFTIIEKVNAVDYKVSINGKIKTYHGNMLQRYHRRLSTDEDIGDVDTQTVSCVAVIEEQDVGIEPEVYHEVDKRGVCMEFPSYAAKESNSDVQVNKDLMPESQAEVWQLLTDFSDVFTDVPGTTNIVEHEKVVTPSQPVRSRQYPAPYSLKKNIKQEIENMIKLDIIEPCNSTYASPVVMVSKSDGTYRFCCNFCKLNSITVSDAEPIGNQEEIFSKMAQSKYFTKIDLSTGYCQIKMKKSSQPLTTVITSEGLFSFKKMPFELINSGATFCRMMRVLLKGLENTDNFVDDIIVHTQSWQVHISCLRQLFQRLREALLTARPSKCVLGVETIGFLGHVLGAGTIKPNPEKSEGYKKMSETYQ